MVVDRDTFNVETIKETGVYAQKILVTLNAGGIVTVLAFIGNIEGNDTVAFDVDMIKLSIVGFVLGLAFVGVSLFTVYFEAQRRLIEPERGDTSFTWFLVKMVGPPLASFTCFSTSIGFTLGGVTAP